MLPTSFALVGKTLAQADSIARTLDPELDPIELLQVDSLELMLREAERRLTPNALSTYAFTQLAPLARLPRRIGQVADRLEEGTLRIGIAPTRLEGLEAVLRGAANRIGAALIVSALLVSSALMARVNDALGRRVRALLRSRPLHALEDHPDSREPVEQAGPSDAVAKMTRRQAPPSPDNGGGSCRRRYDGIRAVGSALTGALPAGHHSPSTEPPPSNSRPPR